MVLVRGLAQASRFANLRPNNRLTPHYLLSSTLASNIVQKQQERPRSLLHSFLSYPPLDYARGWAWQQVLLSRRLAVRRSTAQPYDQDAILVLEHAPVYTLGRGADERHLTFCQDDHEARQRLCRKNRGPTSARLALDRPSTNGWQQPQAMEALLAATSATPVQAPNGVDVYRVERGGQVTYHGPGQLVVYPMMDLRRPPFRDDLHWFLRQVEEVILRTLAHYKIDGVRDDEHTGVWVDKHKIAAVGVSASRWITTHGFAINVDCDLSYFDTSVILPCGIEGRGVTSMATVLNDRRQRVPSVPEVAAIVVQEMQHVFEIEVEAGPDLS